MQLIAADWPAPAGVIAGTTTRAGGVSGGRYASLNLGLHVGDDPGAVLENRRRLVAALGLPAEPRWLDQVHGAAVIDSDALDPVAAPPVADAAVSPSGKSVLGILTADCLPILLCDTNSPAIGALHCGWRSLAAGIVEASVRKLGVDPEGLLAWLGPAISQPAFEVGDDVRDLFLAGIEGAAACFVPNRNGRWQADLVALARLYLARAGVAQVYGGGWCTAGRADLFYSYRRDGPTGRIASVVGHREAVAVKRSP